MPDFFILGFPRSGTTLCRLMINSHPELVVPPEGGFALWLYEEYAKKKLKRENCISYFRAVMSTKKFEHWSLSLEELISGRDKNPPKSYSDLVAIIYHEYKKKKSRDALLVGDKNNFYIWHVGKIKKIFGGVKKLFIVRDGRDVAASHLEISGKNMVSQYRPDFSTDVSTIAYEWKSAVRIILKHKDDPNSLIIRYEDLVLDTVSILKNISDFLGVDYRDEMTLYYENNDEPTEMMEWKKETKRPLLSSKIQRYKKDLSGHQLEKFEAKAADELEIFEYL